jgi:hypothetical protein
VVCDQRVHLCGLDYPTVRSTVATAHAYRAFGRGLCIVHKSGRSADHGRGGWGETVAAVGLCSR